ncbi:ketopantoate hydroxymethyltransferase-domain-containing protein [Ilyonectria destructans]|nr:ketopantoate hydroxymethyltransferase-domain-containing protein [Ilyonectria destructans]
MSSVVAPFVRSCASSLLSRSTRPLRLASWTLGTATRPLAVAQARHSSHSPMGSTPTNQRKKVTLGTIRSLHRKQDPITVMTAHDFPSAHVADHAGMDVVLVGDSLAMVALGMEDTSEILLDEMILHCRSVARATKSAFTVGDLPMGSYEISPEQALASAIRVIKEGRVQSVKLEGGKEMASTIRKITTAGIPVLGHIGLTPQRQNALGGFRVQGKTSNSALSILEDALAIQEAGCFAMVIEAVPAEVAALITEKLSVPTIGIGAGNGCSGQVLVQIDMIGNFPPGRFLPKFVKKYGDVWGESMKAIEAYRDEVKSREYPAPEHTYPISSEELETFTKAFPTTSSNDGANALLTYKNTLSEFLHRSLRRRYRTTSSNLRAALILHTSCASAGADPTGLNFITTLSTAKPPALASAALASRGRSARTTEADMVSSRSGDSARSGVSVSASTSTAGGDGDDMPSCGGG